jgi:hypothetical protein
MEDMAVPRPLDVSLAARLGIWLGAGGWLLGFAFVTAPDSFRFLPVLAGAIAATLFVALALDRLARVTPHYLAGASCLAVVGLGIYWSLAIAPAVEAHPEVLARLALLGVSAEFPPHITFTVAVVGCLLLVRGRRRGPSGARARQLRPG